MLYSIGLSSRDSSFTSRLWKGTESIYREIVEKGKGLCVFGGWDGASPISFSNSVWEAASMGPLREFERHSQHLGTTENCAFWDSRVEVANTSRAYWDRMSEGFPCSPCGKKILLLVERMKRLLIVKVQIEWATVKLSGPRRAVIHMSKG